MGVHGQKKVRMSQEKLYKIAPLAEPSARRSCCGCPSCTLCRFEFYVVASFGGVARGEPPTCMALREHIQCLGDRTCLGFWKKSQALAVKCFFLFSVVHFAHSSLILEIMTYDRPVSTMCTNHSSNRNRQPTFHTCFFGQLDCCQQKTKLILGEGSLQRFDRCLLR